MSAAHKRAALWLAVLAPVFYLSYGLANHWAAGRAQVPSVVFDWEHAIPFWSWTIYPYWSINAFYALSLFLARDRFTLDRHGARLLTVQAIAVTCFVLWPLHFSFGQPTLEEGDPAGWLFTALRGFDQPYNQAPSLHIALAVILWDWYRRCITQRWARVLLHGWTLAICISVLTTWQHHFIDVPTGALLGVLCVWAWPLERRALPWRRVSRDPQRLRLAGQYLVGAVALALPALAFGGWGLWLLWPALSLVAVALNYAVLGAQGFQMGRDGRMAWAARWLFAPYRLGAAVNAWCWTRRQRAADLVLPGVLLGRMPSQRAWEAAGRPRILSLCAERQVPAAARGHTVCLPLLDLVAPTPAALHRAALMLQRQRQDGATVWVCCALGYSRSAAAVVSWLAATGEAWSVGQAQALVRQARPQIVLRHAWQGALLQAGSMPLPLLGRGAS